MPVVTEQRRRNMSYTRWFEIVKDDASFERRKENVNGIADILRISMENGSLYSYQACFLLSPV